MYFNNLLNNTILFIIISNLSINLFLNHINIIIINKLINIYK